MAITEDPSTRFLSPADSPLPANLAALWAADAGLAMLVERADATHCHVNPSKAGPPTLSWADPTGRAVHLHSRYDPPDEARRLVDSIDTSAALLLFIHGLGLGYHVEELFRRASREAILFVFEPRAEIIRA